MQGYNPTYGNDGAWRNPYNEVNGPDDYNYYIAGQNNPQNNGTRYSTSNNTLPTSGTYYVFNPTKDGKLKVAVEIFTNKQLFVTEDATAIDVDLNGSTMTPGSVASSSGLTFGYITFNVTAGREYYVFCISSKLMLFGFEFITSASSDDTPSEPSQPDDTIAVSTDSIVMPTVPSIAGTPLSFESNACYSKLVIDSRINSFYANTTKVGFGKFNDKGEKTETEFGSSTKLDYVPGLVAKAVIEAVDYYKDSKTIDVLPWYYAVQSYACKNDISSNGKAGKSFDDLNAVKLYGTLRELSEDAAFPDGALYSNDETVTIADTRFADALAGIRTANESYSIKEGAEAAIGGWWHKYGYVNQMWCDGQYMGPALLAQMINGYKDYSKISDNDWDLITKQFTICWQFLWDADDELMYHAFSSTPTDSYASTWADATTYHSKEYWGRADGWYFLALVDVLEEMQKAGLTNSANYTTLHAYLEKIAAGIAKRQDSNTGCWYQLLQYDDTFYANSYNGMNYSKTYNYLESSATAIFLAAYMKGMRLGLISSDYAALAKKGYKGIVENFMVSDGNGGVHLVNSCRSAGLGGYSYRDGSAAYYLLGSDVTRVKVSDKQTEGKVLGAFILAATEYERSFVNTPGDVNGDGIVDIHDATAVMEHYVGLTPEVFNATAADVNNDGKITMADSNCIVNTKR